MAALCSYSSTGMLKQMQNIIWKIFYKECWNPWQTNILNADRGYYGSEQLLSLHVNYEWLINKVFRLIFTAKWQLKFLDANPLDYLCLELVFWNASFALKNITVLIISTKSCSHDLISTPKVISKNRFRKTFFFCCCKAARLLEKRKPSKEIFFSKFFLFECQLYTALVKILPTRLISWLFLAISWRFNIPSQVILILID